MVELCGQEVPMIREGYRGVTDTDFDKNWQRTIRCNIPVLFFLSCHMKMNRLALKEQFSKLTDVFLGHDILDRVKGSFERSIGTTGTDNLRLVAGIS